MLRTKLFKGFAILVVLYSLLSAVIGISTLDKRVKGEAQKRVSLDISSAWAVYNSRLSEIETVLRLVAGKTVLVEACQAGDYENAEVLNRLERIRASFGLDFMGVVAVDGIVAMRATPPYTTGDSRAGDVAVAAALKGQTKCCMAVFSQTELQREAVGLADKAYMELKDTPKARRTNRLVEDRGMVMEGAVPVMVGAQVVGVVYGGILVNRNHALIDRIHDVVYRQEKYEGRPLGTATIFLADSRIATTVRERNGNRALGTRVSKEVADRVLDNGQPWVDEAFVVTDWYLSAYDPIKSCSGEVIGMLYVGVLKAPFERDERDIAVRYILLSIFVLFVALAIAFFTAGRLSQPIHRLVEASNRLRRGERPGPVAIDRACQETETLIAAFNEMTRTLAEREENLKALNRSYMETVGFVAHELKSPVATMMNYVYLLRERRLGPLTEPQEKAVRALDSGSKRLVEMVRHYLNLSRIENGELSPVPTRVAVREDVIDPLLETSEPDIAAKEQALDIQVPETVVLRADLNMVREVFENMVGNAIKYGRQGGRIRVTSAAVNGHVEFSVWNEGEGIPESKMGELFQKFSRLEGTRAAGKQKGTGLGLFISKSIVEAHGGRIEVASREGEWTEFKFSFPVNKEGEGSVDA